METFLTHFRIRDNQSFCPCGSFSHHEKTNISDQIQILSYQGIVKSIEKYGIQNLNNLLAQKRYPFQLHVIINNTDPLMIDFERENYQQLVIPQIPLRNENPSAIILATFYFPHKLERRYVSALTDNVWKEIPSNYDEYNLFWRQQPIEWVKGVICPAFYLLKPIDACQKCQCFNCLPPIPLLVNWKKIISKCHPDKRSLCGICGQNDHANNKQLNFQIGTSIVPPHKCYCFYCISGKYSGLIGACRRFIGWNTNYDETMSIEVFNFMVLHMKLDPNIQGLKTINETLKSMWSLA